MEATLSILLNTQAFDPAHRGVSLLPPGRHLQPTTPAPAATIAAPMSELGHLSTLVTTLLGAANPKTPSHPVSVATVQPTTPPAITPVHLVPSPSDLPRFLLYASSNLGVCNTLEFESPLHCKGYGPDILPWVADSSLTALSITDGDVLRLKEGSRAWWNGPNAK